MLLLLEQWHQQNPTKCCQLFHWIPCSVSSIAFFRIKSMTRRKRNGDKIHPFLALASVLKNSELAFSVFIQQLLFKYMFLIDFDVFLWDTIRLQSSTVTHGVHCQRLFLKSTKFNEIGCWNSVLCSMFLSVKICSEQDRLLLKPACCSLSFKSMESFRRFRSIILSTFPRIDNSVTPLQLLQFDELPFYSEFHNHPFSPFFWNKLMLPSII